MPTFHGNSHKPRPRLRSGTAEAELEAALPTAAYPDPSATPANGVGYGSLSLNV